MSGTICNRTTVQFPMHRESQSNNLMALGGDALLRGDWIAWRVLFRASIELKEAPAYGSEEAEIENMKIKATLGA